VIVERVPINHIVEGPVSVRSEGDTLVISLLEEVLVVEKRLLLKEEVRITRRRVDTHAPQRVTLRREDAVVKRINREGDESNPGTSWWYPGKSEVASGIGGSGAPLERAQPQSKGGRYVVA
jgi:stress response protein YsnF